MTDYDKGWWSGYAQALTDMQANFVKIIDQFNAQLGRVERAEHDKYEDMVYRQLDKEDF